MNQDLLPEIDKTISVLDRFFDLKLVSEYEHGKQKDFLISVRQCVITRGRMTVGQTQWFSSLKQRYTEEKLHDNDEWIKNYGEEQKRNALRVAGYYAENPPYFQWFVKRVLSDPNCVLTLQEYNKVCNNKYAKKVLAEYEKEPKYKKGELVQFRSTILSRDLANVPAVVLEVDAAPITRAKAGAKVYKILPVGLPPRLVCESDIKKARRKNSK